MFVHYNSIKIYISLLPIKIYNFVWYSYTFKILFSGLWNVYFYCIYSALIEELLEYVDIENPIISVKYVNNDGSVITEKSFDKSILEETTSDVNSSDEKSV